MKRDEPLGKWVIWVPLVAIAFLAFFGGRYAGERFVAAKRIRARADFSSWVGKEIPNAAVYRSDGTTSMLHTMFPEAEETVVIILTPGCSRCLAEASEWEELSERYEDDLDFLAVVITPDASVAEEIRKGAGLRFPLFVSNEGFQKSLTMGLTPTIYVIDWENRIQFGAGGAAATREVSEWIESRYGQDSSQGNELS